jgi:hypothetical protein
MIVLALGQDLTAAEDLLREAEQWLDPARSFAVLEYHGARARLAALLLRDGDAVLAHSELAIAAARRAHVPPTVMAFARQLLPTGYVLRGEFALAIAETEATAKDAFPEADIHRMVPMSRLSGTGRAPRGPRRSQRVGKGARIDRTFFQSLHREALWRGRDGSWNRSRVVTCAIRQRKLKTPSLSIAAAVAGQGFTVSARLPSSTWRVIALSGKAQKKPLEPHKALVAAGGRPTSAASRRDLWPDAEEMLRRPRCG